MSTKDLGLFALFGLNVLLVLALLIWYLRGLKHGPYGPNGRWRYLALYYALLIGVIVETTVVGVLLLG